MKFLGAAIKRYRYLLYSAFLLISDVAAYFAALALAYELRLLAEIIMPVTKLQFSLEYFAGLWWIPCIVLFFQAAGGTYRRRDPLWIESGKVLKSLAMSFIVTFTIVSLGQMSGDISRLFLCLLWVIAPFTFIVFRMITKRLLFKSAFFQTNALLVGYKARLDTVARAFEAERYLGLRIVRSIALEPRLNIKDIDEIIEKEAVDTAIMVPPPDTDRSVAGLFSHIHTKVRHMLHIPERSAIDLTNAETGQLLRSQQGYLLVNNGMQSHFSRFLKRGFDLAVALLLTPFVVPVVAGLVVLIRATSPGNGIFSHERVGRDGKTFKVYKLRTMYKDADVRLKEMIANDPAVKAEWDATYKLKNDPRITKLGKFLRKSSLDELPQFFNVFKGDMSFVGPRPVLRAELEKYYKDQAVYYCMAKPGITGLWQISGRNDTTYDDRVEMDSWYVFNWSLWLDIVILFSTPLVVIFRKGAY